MLEPLATAEPPLSRFIDGDASESAVAGIEPNPADLVLTCANCGARMDERKCKLVCRCGYFASCSDYY